jgi:hypothetical protein
MTQSHPVLELRVALTTADYERLVHPPIVTPWGHRNARLCDPDGMQITLFQVLDSPGAQA